MFQSAPEIYSEDKALLRGYKDTASIKRVRDDVVFIL